jgi:Holliday junction resolvase RusA-like endonuclease
VIELDIKGEIPVKKNRQRIGAHGGIYKDPASREYEEMVGWECRLKRIEPIEGPFAIGGVFYINPRKDLDGVLTTLLDALQRAGAIENDKLLSEIRLLKKIPVAKGAQERVQIRIEAYT